MGEPINKELTLADGVKFLFDYSNRSYLANTILYKLHKSPKTGKFSVLPFSAFYTKYHFSQSTIEKFVYASEELAEAEAFRVNKLFRDVVIPKTNKEHEDVKESLRAVSIFLEEARRHGLESEVVVWALDSMKSDPNQTVSQAMSDGFNEWVK